MRGFNASNSLFVDNVRDGGLAARDVFNLEQVEVFMGPTGSDVGRGTATLRNMADEDAASATGDRGEGDPRHRRSVKRLHIDINQTLSSGGERPLDRAVGSALERTRAGQRVAGRDEVTNASKGFAPSTRRWPRHCAPASPLRRRSCGRTTCPTTGSLARRGTNRCWRRPPCSRRRTSRQPTTTVDRVRSRRSGAGHS